MVLRRILASLLLMFSMLSGAISEYVNFVKCMASLKEKSYFQGPAVAFCSGFKFVYPVSNTLDRSEEDLSSDRLFG